MIASERTLQEARDELDRKETKRNTVGNAARKKYIPLDWYSGSLKGALELPRNGDKIGEQFERCEPPAIRKYRKVATNDYLVVDCRPSKQSSSTVQPAEHRCTLFFEDDFAHCISQMRMEGEMVLRLLEN